MYNPCPRYLLVALFCLEQPFDKVACLLIVERKRTRLMTGCSGVWLLCRCNDRACTEADSPRTVPSCTSYGPTNRSSLKYVTPIDSSSIMYGSIANPRSCKVWRDTICKTYRWGISHSNRYSSLNNLWLSASSPIALAMQRGCKGRAFMQGPYPWLLPVSATRPHKQSATFSAMSSQDWASLSECRHERLPTLLLGRTVATEKECVPSLRLLLQRIVTRGFWVGHDNFFFGYFDSPHYWLLLFWRYRNANTTLEARFL